MQKQETKKMVLGAVLTALVIILQFLGAFVKFGPFSISLVLVPIVIGGAICGKKIAAWLGFVFGMVVLLNGDAAAFMAVNPWGTIITVLLKGTLCGLLAGITYDIFKKNRYLRVISSAIICPVVNTGIFLIGWIIFFMPTLSVWANGSNVWEYMIFVLVGGNFLVELVANIILSPIIIRLLSIKKITN